MFTTIENGTFADIVCVAIYGFNIAIVAGLLANKEMVVRGYELCYTEVDKYCSVEKRVIRMSGERQPSPAEDTKLAVGVQPPGFDPVTYEALDEIVQRIVSQLQPERIILFGSYGYGSPTENSDVDLLVIMNTGDRPADRYLAVSRLIRPRPFPLDILVKTPDEISRALEKGDFFIREIVTQGQTLYERPN